MPQVESTVHPLLIYCTLPIPMITLRALYPHLRSLYFLPVLGFSCTGHNHSTPMTVLFQNAFYVGNTFNGILYGEFLSWLPPRRGGGARKR